MIITILLIPNSVRSAIGDVIHGIEQQSPYDEFMKLGPQVGQEAPEIEGTTLDGELIRLSDYRGKVVYLNFWADG